MDTIKTHWSNVAQHQWPIGHGRPHCPPFHAAPCAALGSPAPVGASGFLHVSSVAGPLAAVAGFKTTHVCSRAHGGLLAVCTAERAGNKFREREGVSCRRILGRCGSALSQTGNVFGSRDGNIQNSP